MTSTQLNPAPSSPTTTTKDRSYFKHCRVLLYTHGLVWYHLNNEALVQHDSSRCGFGDATQAGWAAYAQKRHQGVVLGFGFFGVFLGRTRRAPLFLIAPFGFAASERAITSPPPQTPAATGAGKETQQFLLPSLASGFKRFKLDTGCGSSVASGMPAGKNTPGMALLRATGHPGGQRLVPAGEAGGSQRIHPRMGRSSAGSGQTAVPPGRSGQCHKPNLFLVLLLLLLECTVTYY